MLPGTANFLLLHPSDNLLVCCKDTKEGSAVRIDGKDFVLSTDIETGHKIARRFLLSGQKLIKYGAPIGSTTADIQPAEHIHVHNMKSDYIPTHTRDSSSAEKR